MGRHAAPSDDEPEVDEAESTDSETTDSETTASESVTVPLGDVADAVRPAGSRPLPGPRGRHSHPDDDDDDPADVAPKRERATAADLRLLRTDAALRSRVVAAIVVPFVVYVLVLLAIGRMDAFAVWVWVPLITAGIGAGLLLDAAHSKEKKAAGRPEGQ